MQTFLSRSAVQTKGFAADLAKKIINASMGRKKALVLALQGDLGGGKTTFVQGLAKGLGIKEKILSPTFVVMKRFSTFYHFDCYRIQKPEEILSLGWQEIINEPQNIVVVEWAEKIKKLLPRDTLWLKFYFVSESKRKIVLLR